MADKNKDLSLDLLGIKPIGDAANTAVNKTFDGVGVFLKAVCMPAFEEFGLLLEDQVRKWRLYNIANILKKAEGKLDFENDGLTFKAHPRVALGIMENCSLIDDEYLQDLWAGLFASSCSKLGQEDENLIFIDILKQLTACEARILKFSCENVRKILYDNGLIVPDELTVSCNEIIEISGITDIYRLDRELDHLRSLELIGNSLGGGGFTPSDNDLNADISPTALTLNLFVKCQGHNYDPKDFWRERLITIADKRKLDSEKGR